MTQTFILQIPPFQTRHKSRSQIAKINKRKINYLQFAFNAFLEKKCEKKWKKYIQYILLIMVKIDFRIYLASRIQYINWTED